MNFPLPAKINCLTEHRWRRLAEREPNLFELLKTGLWTPIRQAKNRAAFRVDTDRGAFFVKHYFPASLRDQLSVFVIHRKASKAMRLGELLRRNHLATPEPRAYYISGYIVPLQAVFVSAWLDGLVLWRQFLSAAGQGGTGDQVREGLLAMARCLGTLHHCGYYHGDLHSNILLRHEAGGVTAYLVDLDDLRYPLSRKLQTRNLESMVRDTTKAGFLNQSWMESFLGSYASAANVSAEEAAAFYDEGKLNRVRGKI